MAEAAREKPAGYITAAYVALIPIAQEKAREIGYCVAVHGSLNRDLDLVAIPWREDAADAKEVHQLFVDLFCRYTEASLDNPAYGPELKAHGRMSWIIPLGFGAAIDLSVIPKRPRYEPQRV